MDLRVSVINNNAFLFVDLQKIVPLLDLPVVNCSTDTGPGMGVGGLFIDSTPTNRSPWRYRTAERTDTRQLFIIAYNDRPDDRHQREPTATVIVYSSAYGQDRTRNNHGSVSLKRIFMILSLYCCRLGDDFVSIMTSSHFHLIRRFVSSICIFRFSSSSLPAPFLFSSLVPTSSLSLPYLFIFFYFLHILFTSVSISSKAIIFRDSGYLHVRVERLLRRQERLLCVLSSVFWVRLRAIPRRQAICTYVRSIK